MSKLKCKVLYKATSVEALKHNLEHHKKYIDGLAFDPENMLFLKDLLPIIQPALNQYSMMLIGSKDQLLNALDLLLNNAECNVLVALDELENLVELKRKYSDSKNIIFGIRIIKPALNLAQFVRYGVRFIALPPTIIKGRLLSESRARKVSVVATTVNDVATYARLSELGVYAIVTTNPVIKRDAKKIIKL